MTTNISAINVYSELNEWIDFCILPVNEEDTKTINEILNQAYDDWFNDAELGDLPIIDYICHKLDECNISYEIYLKLFV